MSSAAGRGTAPPPNIGDALFNVGGGATRRPSRAQLRGSHTRVEQPLNGEPANREPRHRALFAAAQARQATTVWRV
jgi:hypothetical protein